MKKLFLVAILLLWMPGFALADEPIAVTSTDLIEQAAALDQQSVTFSGEVIGDIMRRGDYGWINVSDGSNAIGIWVKMTDQVAALTPGRYGEIGDEVSVTGVYHRACREHGGDLDIHAETLTLVQKGHAVTQPVIGWQLWLMCLLIPADAYLLYTLWRRRQRTA